MSNPQPGDFGLTRLNGPSGWGIRFGQWLNGDGFANYEHAFIVVDDNQIVQAAPGGANLASLASYDPVGVEYSHWDLTDQQRASVVAAAMALIGTPYSAMDYFALVAHRFHLPLPWLKAYVASGKHLICSQLVDATYSAAGLTMFGDGRWDGYVTPASLQRVLTGPLKG